VPTIIVVHNYNATMAVLSHRYAAVDTTVNRDWIHPKDIFRVNDRIQVHGTQTRHHGRIARINSIGDRRLSVTFKDGLSGKFIEYTDAVLIPERGVEATVTTPARLRTTLQSVPPTEVIRTPRRVRAEPQSIYPETAADNMTTIEPDGPDDDYSILQDDNNGSNEPSTPAMILSIATDRILDQFSITAATLITQCDNKQEMEQLMQRFIRQLRLDVDTLAPDHE
jgi:hypothetical protein